MVDNLGDVGVAWRLAADLAGRGETIRLAIDDASALAWMAPAGAPRVEVVGWDAALAAPVDVLVELFGAGLPKGAERAAVRIDVEHLSGESFVERSHGLARGVGPAQVWHYYPGFSTRTGGLLHEPGLPAARRAFTDGGEWLRSIGVEAGSKERRVSLFCYDNGALEAAVDALATEPTLLVATAGHAARQVSALLGPGLRRGALRAVVLPWLSQHDFDRLLWSCDLNLVRGEDSLVRALWAGAPFLWQLYVQRDGAHLAKLEAFLGHLLAGVEPALAGTVRDAFERWNGLHAGSPFELPALEPWRRGVTDWRGALEARPDLTSQLIEFARSRR